MHIRWPKGAGVSAAPNRDEIVALLGVKLGGADSHRHFRSHRAGLVDAIRSDAIGDAIPIGGDLAKRSTRNNRPVRLRIGDAHHQGEDDDVCKSRRGAAPRRLNHAARGA